ncbi:transcription factor bHLH110-like isoform X2 [Populus alba x Populus x berolinensis]|nr:transcription factor bHLH110-like isoform X2 [Populus alba x Populus x berolinensis]
MESANLHHQHQLQDQFVGSSSLTTATPSSYAEAGSAHAWTQTITLNSDNSSPSYNGVILNQRQKNESPVSSLNSNMFQDLGFHYWNNNAGNFSSHSAYDLQLSKIKEGLSSSSDSFPKFTEMLNSPSSTIEDPHVSSLSYIKDELKDLSLSEKLLLETISSGFPINGHDQFSPRQISSCHHNCSSFGSAIPSRGSFSQIYPSINISNFNQPSSPLISGSFDMNLQALDLLTSTRFSGSFPQPASLDPLDMFKDSLSFGLDSIQQSNQRPSCSPSKISSTNEITEAKRPNNSMMEPKATQAAAPKKSRLESRSPCPPFKVRKEKLGDRIAALQQLVAPFGKTDTASVLMEAIGYIKFLQNQVEASNSGGEESKRDLRSRGLCLVPLSCMSYVAPDGGGGGIWPPPNFGGGT